MYMYKYTVNKCGIYNTVKSIAIGWLKVTRDYLRGKTPKVTFRNNPHSPSNRISTDTNIYAYIFSLICIIVRPCDDIVSR